MSKPIRTIAAVATVGTLLSGCGATRLFTDRDELIAPMSPCVEQRFDIYFRESQAGLTQDAAELIRQRAASLEACDIRRVRVLGLADAVGGTDRTNLTLSQRRAEAVAQAFAASGWPAPAFEVEAAGAAGAVTATGAQEPLRRRTEVVVEAAPR